MKHTNMQLRSIGVKTVATKLLGSPFITRENYAFYRLIEVCEGSPAQTWADNSEDDYTNRIKMEMPFFDGQNVEAFAERLSRYLVLTGRTKEKSRVEANLIEQGLRDKDLQDRVCKVLKTSKSLKGFLWRSAEAVPSCRDKSDRDWRISQGTAPAI